VKRLHVDWLDLPNRTADNITLAYVLCVIRCNCSYFPPIKPTCVRLSVSLFVDVDHMEWCPMSNVYPRYITARLLSLKRVSNNCAVWNTK